jgi:uncharacterized protein YceH (UPF0502 family)
MTQDEIVAMARYAGIEDSNEYDHLVCTEVELLAFAKLVAEAEREACAKISDDADGYSRFVNQFISKRIRARGEA